MRLRDLVDTGIRLPAALLPRARMSFPRNVHSWSYYEPQPSPALCITPDDLPEPTTINVRRMDCRWMSATFEFQTTPELFGADRVWCEQYGEGPITQRIKEGLLENGYVVGNTDHPDYDVRITVHVIGSVRAWPDVPGVTTPPWRTCAPDIDIPHTLNGMDQIGRLACESMRNGAWEFVLLCSPDDQSFLVHGPGQTIENIARIIPDDRVPRGKLRPAERVASQ